MTNENELDLEKKFLSDIEKATALSLEEKALEDFRRQKLYGQTSVVDGPTSSATTTKNSKSSITLQDYQKILKQRQLSLTTEAESTKSNQNVRRSTMIAPPPLFSPRRNSMEIRGTPSPSTTSNSTITNTAGSIVKKSEQKEYEPDLISFTSPTSTNDSNHANFVQLCDEINKINMRSNSVDAATLQYNRISPTPIFQASHAQSQMQIVPYTPQQKPSLAPEELSKLYSMNTVVGGYGLQRHGMMMNSQQPLTYQSPIQSNLMPQQNFHMPQNPTQQYYNSTSYMSQTSSPMPGGLQPFNLTFMRQPSMPVIASQSTPSPIQLNNVQMYATNRPHTPQELPSYVTSARQNQFQRDLTPSPSGGVNTSILTPLSQSNSTPTFNTYSSGSGVGSGSGMGPSTSGISLNTSMNSSGTTEPRLRRIVEPTKKKGDNLIDLDFDTNSRVDVLEAFDPLLTCDQSDTASDYYYEDDPFDYLYSGGTTCSDPVYDAVIKVEKHPFNGALTSGDIYSSTSEPGTSTVAIAAADTIPPPLPPRNSNEFRRDNPNVVLDRRKIGEKLYENIVIKKSYDLELVEFYNMVLKMRSMFKVDDERTNVGHVVASEFPNKFPDELSIMLLVHPSLDCFKMGRNHERGQIEGYGPPVAFTCSITSTVDHILTHVLYTLEGKTCELNAKDYMLRPIGIMEWLRPTSRLNQLECVHDSCKLEKDVQLCMCPKNSVNLQAIARTAQDDRRDAEIKLEDILPNESVSPINYESLMIILETLETEIDRLESAASDSGPHSVVSCAGVVQAIKAVCSLLGYIETLEISEATNHLKEVCTSRSYERSEILYGDKIDVLSDDGDYSSVKLRPRTFVEQIRKSCHQVRDAVQQLLDIYSHAFRVDFCVKSLAYPFKTISLASIIDPVVVSVSCLYRLPPHWKYDDYLLGTQIYHGTRFIVEPQVTQCVIENVGSYPRLKFKSWLYFHNTPVCVLPRESRLLFVLFGCTNETESNDKNDSKNQNSNGEPRQTKTELGWFSIQFFDFERRMITGSYLLPMWPPTTDKYLGPAPARGTHPYGNQFPVLGIEIPPYEGRVVFPEPLGNMPPAPKLDFNSLDVNLQQELIDTAEQGYQSAVDKREVLWEKRYYLQNFPHALPKVLSAAHSWDHASLVDMHALIRSWHELSPIQALELFLPKYPDLEVRSFAVKWFSRIENDQFVDYLPQLVQSLKHDTYEASSMAQLLLSRSLESPRIAHHLYWLLVHSLPGDSPQNSNNLEMSMHNANMELITQSRYHRRNQILLRALLATCGEKLSTRFLSQNMMCKMLGDIAQSVKQNKNKQAILVQKLEQIHHHLLERPTALPLNPGLEVAGVVTSQCSYFNSNTLPLKISFIGPDQQLIPAIFKSGDDLQQDMLTLQLVRLMDKLWLKEGLDLKMVTFSCVPTSEKKGMIELVSDAETLRKIQVEWGLTGSFKDKPIAEWLARQNPNPFDYQRAVDNFTVSCAGYSVATYILGICDRHNDNIMLKTSGHIFHIDFGKFLGDAQMFGNFKRDRTPFVLTSDMAYVINGGDKPSTKFHHFVDLCCQAFNIVRKHGDLLLHMLTLMAHSGIPGVSADSVNYVRKALLPGQSNAEAAASFAKMIHISLKSWFTQFNFFLHNLAQLKFSSEEGNGELLSFVPRTYTTLRRKRGFTFERLKSESD